MTENCCTQCSKLGGYKTAALNTTWSRNPDWRKKKINEERRGPHLRPGGMCSFWGSSISWAAQLGTWIFIVILLGEGLASLGMRSLELRAVSLQSSGRKTLWFIVAVYTGHSYTQSGGRCCYSSLSLNPQEEFAIPEDLRHWGPWHGITQLLSNNKPLPKISSALDTFIQGFLPTTGQYLDQSSRCHYLPICDRWGDLAWDDLNEKCFP